MPIPGWPVSGIEREWQGLQAAVARQSSRGRLVMAAQSGHFVHHDQPELVITVIRNVVEEVRAHAGWERASRAQTE